MLPIEKLKSGTKLPKSTVPGGFRRKKRHSTRRDVNFLNMNKNLDFYQKRGLGEQERRKFGYFLYGHCVDVFPPTLMGKGVFGF